MDLQITNATFHHNTQAAPRQSDPIPARSPESSQDTPSRTQPAGTVLRLTHIIRGRAELAALRLASGRLMGDMSGIQALEEGVREIQTIVQQLGEISGKAAQMGDSHSATRLELEVERLGRRIYQILAAHISGRGYSTPETPASTTEPDSPGPAELFALAIQDTVDRTFSGLDYADPAAAAQNHNDLDALTVRLADISRELTAARELMRESYEQTARQSRPEPEQATRLLAQIHDALLTRPDTASLAQAHQISGNLRVQAVG